MALATLFVAAIDTVDRFRPSTGATSVFLAVLAVVVIVSAFARMITVSSKAVVSAERALRDLPITASATELGAVVASVWHALFERSMKISAFKRAALRVASLLLYVSVIALMILGVLELEKHTVS